MSEARSLALFFACFGPAACALVAWLPASPAFPLVALAVALAGAQTAGDVVGTDAPLLREQGAFKVRAWAMSAVLGVVLLVVALASVLPRPVLLWKEVLALLVLQVALLALPALGPGRLPALGVSLALAVLASYRGGPLAAGAVTSFFAGGCVFLGLDHFERRLQPQPLARRRLAGIALRESVGASALPTGLMLVFFIAAPPRPHVGLDSATLESLLENDKMAPAYMQLALVSLLGSVLVHYISRWLRGSGGGQRTALDMLVPERGQEEVLRREEVFLDHAGPRGSIVRAYTSFLAEAAGRILLRRPDQTPGELASSLRTPGSTLSRLTALFSAARYGPQDPSEAEVREAASASATLVEWLRSRDKPRAS